jgi:hypothetical protein
MDALFASQGRGAYNIAASTSTTIREIVVELGMITGRSDLSTGDPAGKYWS